MRREEQEAFVEVDEILKIMPVDLVSKIPMQFRQMISENKSKDYKADIKEPLEEENLKEETIVILGLIYRDFLATPEEKKELLEQDSLELQKIQEELEKQYDINNVFSKRKKQAQNEDASAGLIVYKEQGFIKRVFNFIKGLFNKNKF